MSDETDDVLEEAAEQIDAIDQALADFAEHKVHVPEAYMPEDPRQTIGSMSHASLLAFLSEVGIETLSHQEQLLKHFDDGTMHFRTVPGLRPHEEMLEKMGQVRGVRPSQVIFDEAMDLDPERIYFPGEDHPHWWIKDVDFTEAPLFGREDAGLDDLEPDGPINIEGIEGSIEMEMGPVSEDWMRLAVGLPPRRRTIREQLGRTLRACAASVLSRIPGNRS